jgi:hypothetical protein
MQPHCLGKALIGEEPLPDSGDGALGHDTPEVENRAIFGGRAALRSKRADLLRMLTLGYPSRLLF